MNSNPSCFVRLEYSPGNSVSPAHAIPLAVVAKGSELRVAIVPGWRDMVDPQDCEYLDELIHEWRATPANEFQDLMRQLSELSIGPLRAVESGLGGADEVVTADYQN